MTDVVVVGGSISGLVLALALDRRGIEVTVVEADNLDGDVPRRATPQAGHSHAFLARCRQLLAAEAPDVLDDLRAAGCHDISLVDQRPGTVPAGVPHPGDRDLVVIAARRTTFEACLRRAARRRPGISWVDGRVVGLLFSGANDEPARERGAKPAPRSGAGSMGGTRAGSRRVAGVGLDGGRALSARRLVVDASGRRTGMVGWLRDAGVEVGETAEECGIAYLTRFYRGAAGLPLDRGFAAGGSFDRYSCLVFPGDGDTFSVTFGVLPEDRALRSGLREAGAFDAAVRTIPSLASWVDPATAEPDGEVRLMAGLSNRLTRPTVPVIGWTAVGDAAATTNPAHSRGCTLGAVHAVAVADAVAAHRDPADLAEACAAALEREQSPWVADSIEQDRQRLARWRPGSATHDTPAPAPTTTHRLGNGEVYAAARHDAYVWRRFTRLQQLLDRPADVLADPRVVARVRAVQAAGRPGPALAGPTHDELVELLAAAPVG